MDNAAPEAKEKTTLVQSVVPVSVSQEIEVDAAKEGRSVSNVIARILGAHYAKRTAKRRRLQTAA